MGVLKRQLDEYVAYPPHPPRSESAIYRRTHKHLIFDMDAPCWICGIRRSQGGALETHHYRFEWASQFGLDMKKVEADFPNLTDRQKLAEWVDSEGNMLVLCLPGDEPVLMADGSERRLDGVERGDYVVGHDRESHRVTDTMSRLVDEEIIVVDGRRMTTNHLVLTGAGWLPAELLVPGDLTLHVGMCESEMLRLRGVQGQVLDPVVLFTSGSVVDNLSREQTSSEMLLHNPDVLHHLSSFLTFPDVAANIASRSFVTTKEHAVGRSVCSRQRIQRGQATGVRAVAGSRVARSEGHAAVADLGAKRAVSVGAPDSGALARAGRVARGDLRRDQKLAITDEACARGSHLRVDAWWSPVEDIQRVTFRGRVHDISVAGCHSFVASGLVVHNCAAHHRGKYVGIHEITYPAWLLQRYEGAEFSFIDQHSVPVAHTALMSLGDSHPYGP